MQYRDLELTIVIVNTGALSKKSMDFIRLIEILFSMSVPMDLSKAYL